VGVLGIGLHMAPLGKFLRTAMLLCLLCGGLLLRCGTGDPGLGAALSQGFQGRVVAVKDGDTVEVMREGKAVRVRLQHVDCPEKGQPFGTAAKQFTADLCAGRMVRVLAQPKPDRFGRLIATVYTDGRCLNEELVKAGLAWHFTRYSSDVRYAALERSARKARAGLWAEEGAVPPWEWRKERRGR
jgi:micrococcal nuclease